MITRERLTITLRKDLLRCIDDNIDGKTIRNRSHAIEKVLIEKFGDAFLKTAIILGGGKGITIDGVPTSPLCVNVDGIPLVERHISLLKDVGVTTVILAVGDFGGPVRKIVGDGSRYNIRVVYVEHDHGTAGVLRQMRSLLSEPFIMFNGHIVVQDVDLLDMLALHRTTHALGTIAVTTISDPESYGIVRLRGVRIVEFLSGDRSSTSSHLINAGMYILDPSVCTMVRPGEESLEHDIFPQIIAQRKLYGYMLDVPWKRIKA